MTATALTRDEIDAFLREQGSGVLSLTDGAETYAVPESFGYDGGDLYFQLVSEPDSEKLAFIETTDVATLTVFTDTPARSVLVRGPLESVPDADRARASSAIAANATIPTLNVSPDSPTEALSFEFYRLVPQDLTGRAFGITPSRDN
ncbi:pyridoxamine 5'-phosphate oxidase family protein [Natronorubrum sulfidifaciens]|uniref:Pyridoxamine 5'-phosphate oxidase-like FMN-binding protein n=1 Tax=Natronorubrum sulfidifaciens JCM 14089 TaxID=1230460 RepID=L9WA25_9EURY|nr:pyridoxamine 5'-phosphate oxidase family protein [Natronorubrum sulfidifaciens]ELY45163.1 pyridoxamine 5'-phosphate oxidase-like FMN-binding protein [Natronorubrum sulfidifaciens JCM 14089]